MAPLRIGYVREHFSSPLLQYAEDDQGKTFVLVECPGGTGQLIKALEDDRVDIVIALTDALIAGIARGSDYKLVGSFVDTPLNWAIITGKDTPYKSVGDLRGTTFGISRVGSGSESMVKLLALENAWEDRLTGKIEDIKFKVCNNIDGLITAVNDGSCSAFMWEWFTTKPWVDRGEARFIGSLPTPWASWMIAAHNSPTRAPKDDVIKFTATLTKYCNDFDSVESRAQRDIDFIHKTFGYGDEDIRAWLQNVKWPLDCTKINGSMIVKTLNVLQATGVVTRPADGFNVDDFTNTYTVRTE